MHSSFSPPESAGEVLVYGSTPEALDTATLIRRLGEPVSLLPDTFDAATLATARQARAMFIALESDLRCVEVVLAAREAGIDIPIVCNVGDAGLARRLGRSVRTTVCAASIELSAFPLDEDIVLIKHLEPGNVITTIERMEPRRRSRVFDFVSSLTRRMHTDAAARSAQIAIAASALLVAGVRYASVCGDHLFTFIEGAAGEGLPRDTDNFLPLYRRASGGWTSIDQESSFTGDDRILVVAWRRLGRSSV